MKPRGHLAFRPGLAASTGVDCLEYRQLLSVAGTVGEVAEVGRTRAVASPEPASRIDAGSRDATVGSNAQGGDAANPAGNGGGSPAIPVTQSVSSASPSASEGDAGPSDSGEVVTHAVAMTVQPASDVAANAGSAAGLGGAVEQTPGDEGPTVGPASDPSAAEQPGDINATIGAGIGPNGPLDGAASGTTAQSAPASASAPAGIVVVWNASAHPANDGPKAVATGTDGAIPTAGAATDPFTAAPAQVRACRGCEIPEKGTPSEGGGDEVQARAVEEPAPPPRCADLLTEFLPFDRASMEDAIDRFLAPFEDLGTELANWQSPASLIPAATIVAAAALASEVVRRRARGGRTAHEEGEEDFARFPGSPSAWSLGES